MKVAVAAGSARRFVVGDPEIQLIDVLAGALMDRLAGAEHHAERGEVVVESTTLEAVADRMEIAAVRGEPGRPGGGVASGRRRAARLCRHGSPIRASPARSYARGCCRPYTSGMRAGRGEFLAELRPAVPSSSGSAASTTTTTPTRRAAGRLHAAAPSG